MTETPIRLFLAAIAIAFGALRRVFKAWTAPGSGPFLAGC